MNMLDTLKEKLDATDLSDMDKHMWLGVFDDKPSELQETFIALLESQEQEALFDMTKLMRLKLEQLDDSSKDKTIIDFEKELLEKAKSKDSEEKK